jgi:hypothetical protein
LAEVHRGPIEHEKSFLIDVDEDLMSVNRDDSRKRVLRLEAQHLDPLRKQRRPGVSEREEDLFSQNGRFFIHLINIT